MPPKSKSLEDLVAGISDKLDSISEQLQAVKDRQDKQDAKLTHLEQHLEKYEAANAELRKENIELKRNVTTLKEKVNNLEQRNRAPCARIFDIPIAGDSSDNNNVAVQLYQKLLLPILNGATTSGLLEKIPSLNETIETAHILPGPKPNMPILCRFKSLRIKQSKREYAPRAPSRGDKQGALLYPLYTAKNCH